MKHSGEVVNICTEYGANEFLKQYETKDDFKHFSYFFKEVDAHRKSKEKLTDLEMQQMSQIYLVLMAVTSSCDHILFRERVPESEIKAWLNHAAAIFQDVAKSEHWTQQGEMMIHEDSLLACCCFLFKHPLPVALAFEDSAYFESIAALMKARKGVLSSHIAWAIGATIGHMITSALHRFDHPWGVEKIFKKLEAAGILEHYILCMATEQSNAGKSLNKAGIFNNLLPCIAFIKKRFKAGTPCGDSLREILNGGMEVCPRALPYLQDLLKLSNTLQADSGHYERVMRLCHHCCKEEKESKFMICSRCKQICYCSKDCQRADWKQHKRMCMPATKKLLKTRDAAQNLFADYGKKHCVEIMFAIAEEDKKDGGLKMRDMILVLDLIPDTKGNVPALQEIPRFKIISKSTFVQAERERGGEHFEQFATTLNDEQHPDLLGCLVYPDSKSVSGFKVYDPVTGVEMYTKDVLAAFQKAFYDEQYDHLAYIFHRQDRWMHFVQKIGILATMKKTFDATTCLFGSIDPNFVFNANDIGLEGQEAATANSMLEFLKFQQP